MRRSARYRFLNRTAIVFGALAIIIFVAEALVAISRGEIVVGFTYWNAPAFAILQLIVALVAGPFLLRYALRHWNDEKPPIEKRD